MNLLHLKFNGRLHGNDNYWYFRLTVLVILTLLAAGLFVVLYRDFYQTIVQAETVLVLKQEVALQDVNLELFNKVKAVDEYKRGYILPGMIPDPFRTRIDTDKNTEGTDKQKP